MKNVDVPMWDKGDDTDSFTKGGGRSSSPFISSSEKSEELKSIFLLVLGREPSSRESSYYKYSSLKKEQIIDKLLRDDEHTKVLDKAGKYPQIVKDNRKLESTVLKLKSLLEDKGNEHLELKRLIVEKNNTIGSMRENRDIPFLTSRELIQEKNVHYSMSNEPKKEEKKKNFLDRLIYLFFGDK